MLFIIISYKPYDFQLFIGKIRHAFASRQHPGYILVPSIWIDQKSLCINCWFAISTLCCFHRIPPALPPLTICQRKEFLPIPHQKDNHYHQNTLESSPLNLIPVKFNLFPWPGRLQELVLLTRTLLRNSQEIRRNRSIVEIFHCRFQRAAAPHAETDFRSLSKEPRASLIQPVPVEMYSLFLVCSLIVIFLARTDQAARA